MARAWLINSRGFANKVKNCSSHITDCEAIRECPKCRYLITNRDISIEWPGFPTGVKFDPSDTELIEHLAAKCGVGNAKPHMFINEFIPTIEDDIGICYTHPENLPGAKKDGSSMHFFHKTRKAYSTGQRKRRKIDKEHSLASEPVRWHKTGKTKTIENAHHPGCKKIMVLYKSSKKGSKAATANWVLHQYHLGSTDDEREGEYVVSKIFYQRHKHNDDKSVVKESESIKTPMTNAPTTPAMEEPVLRDTDPNEYMPRSSTKVEDYYLQEVVSEFIPLTQFEDNVSQVPQLDNQFEDNMMGQPIWLAGESQAQEYNYEFGGCLDDTLLCKESLNAFTPLNVPVQNPLSNTECTQPFGIPDLENLEVDDPPDFELSGLQFCSQESEFDWFDRLQ